MGRIFYDPRRCVEDESVVKEKGRLDILEPAAPEEDDFDRTVIQGVENLTRKVGKRQAYLIVISGASAGKMFKLTDRMVIGRSSRCEIQLGDKGVSRRHALLICDEKGNAAISDLGSTNGTYYAGQQIKSQHVLKDGDKIQLGSTTILKYSYQDVLEEAFHQHQYEAATKDGLTGIYNKSFFLEQLDKDFSYAYRHVEYLSLLVLDIDHFKKINDTYGHPAGDQVLREVVQLIVRVLRKEDLFARIGGEEFGIILRKIDEKQAHNLAERIRRTVGDHIFRWEGKSLRVTVSLGVATSYRSNYKDTASLIRKADQYLYRAKNAGRNRAASRLNDNLES